MRWRSWAKRAAVAVLWSVAPHAGAARARVAGAQVAIAVSAPATVGARSGVLVRVEVTAPAQAAVRLVPPAFAPFTLQRSDRAPTDTAGLAGRQRLEWRFVLRSGGAGTYAFEPFAADVQGPGLRATTVRSRAWSVAVLPTPVVAGAAGRSEPRPDLAVTDPGRLAFDARIAPERVYVGEQATLELHVGVGAAVRARLRRSPEFAFPTVGGVVSYDLRSRHASAVAGDVHVYRRALFPVAPGAVDVPPAQLVYALTPEDDPFGLEQRVTTRTSPRRLVAVAPPAAGRPAGWDGAVGRYQATARVDTTHARVGDAVVYTLRLEGLGNVMLLPRPRLTMPWADVAPAAERVTVDTAGELAGGAKEFDWLLTPRAAGPASVPAVHYAYFDPHAGYAFADAPAVAVRVAPGAGATPVVAATTPRPAPRRPERALGVLRRWDGERGPALVEQRAFWLVLAGVPAPGALWLVGAAVLARWRDRDRRRAERSPAREGPSDRAAAAAALRRFHAGLAALLAWPRDAHALGPAALERALRRSGIGAALAAECAASADAWARAAYGGGIAHEPSPPPPDRLLARVAAELGARQPSEPTIRAPRPATPAAVGVPRHVLPAFAIGAALLAVALGAPQLRVPRAAPAPTVDRARAASAFDAGVNAYALGDVDGARDLFVVAANAAPAVAPAWINAGTAAWAAGDTASAAFAWQRAVRLTPDAPGLRARLDELPAAGGGAGVFSRADPAFVGGLALAAAAIAALVTFASALGYTRPPRSARPPAVPPAWRAALGTYVVATALAAGAALARQASDPRGLGVVRTAAALRPEPNADAGGAASAATGELAHMLDDEGGWVRVRLEGGREGWLRAAQIAPLDRPL